jgi:hypothetical protein
MILLKSSQVYLLNTLEFQDNLPDSIDVVATDNFKIDCSSKPNPKCVGALFSSNDERSRFFNANSNLKFKIGNTNVQLVNGVLVQI